MAHKARGNNNRERINFFCTVRIWNLEQTTRTSHSYRKVVSTEAPLTDGTSILSQFLFCTRQNRKERNEFPRRRFKPAWS